MLLPLLDRPLFFQNNKLTTKNMPIHFSPFKHLTCHKPNLFTYDFLIERIITLNLQCRISYYLKSFLSHKIKWNKIANIQCRLIVLTNPIFGCCSFNIHHQCLSKSNRYLLAQKGTFQNALTTSLETIVPWIIDSRTTTHIIECANLFSTYTLDSSHLMVKIANGSLATVARIGKIILGTHITLSVVRHIPKH